MRYFIFLTLLVIALPVLGYNEVVSAISYNPSRLGKYSHLKVVKKASLKGGLVSKGTLNIENQVTIKDAQHTSCATPGGNGCNEITNIQPLGGDLCRTRLRVDDTDETKCEWENFSSSAQGGALQGENLTITMTGGNLQILDSDGNTIGNLKLNGGDGIIKVEDTTVVTKSTMNLKKDPSEGVFKLGGVKVQDPNSPTGKSRYGFEDRVDTNGTQYRMFVLR